MKTNLIKYLTVILLISGAAGILSSCNKEGNGSSSGGTAVISGGSRIIGKVTDGKAGLADVLVTDGSRFTRTDKTGFFIMELTKGAEFLSIVTPPGYVADYSSGAPQFYQKVVSGKTSYDFTLTKLSNSPDYNFVVMADPQPKNQAQFDLFKGEPLEELANTCKALAKDRMTIGICLGDIVQDAMNLFASYKEEIRRTGIPFYAVIGNHDFNKDLTGLDAAADFKNAFGPINYAFYLGNDLVVTLNDMEYQTAKKFEESYPEETVLFLKALLAQVPKTTKLYVAQHVPIHRWWKDAPIGRGEEVFALLDGYDVTFLSGHTHVQNITPLRKGIHDHNISGFLGAWWIIDVCRDGTPRGYEIFSRTGTSLSWVYHTVETGDKVQYEIIRPGQSSRNPNSIILNTWDVDDDWKFEWFQDGTPKGQMERVNDISYRYATEIAAAYPGYTSTYDPNVNKHFFKATPDAGAKQVVIKITGHFGQKWEEVIDL